MRAVRVSSLTNDTRGEFTATWMLVSGNNAFFDQPEVAVSRHTTHEKPGLTLWTDDFSSLLPVLHW